MSVTAAILDTLDRGDLEQLADMLAPLILERIAAGVDKLQDVDVDAIEQQLADGTMSTLDAIRQLAGMTGDDPGHSAEPRAVTGEPAAAMRAPGQAREAGARGVASPTGWLNTAQAAEHLACSTDRIHDLVARGRLEPRRDGRRLLFTREMLDAALEPPALHAPRFTQRSHGSRNTSDGGGFSPSSSLSMIESGGRRHGR